MKISTRAIGPAAQFGHTRDAWTAFWQEPGQSRCIAGAPEIWQMLAAHWAAFAEPLASGTRVLDLGCGAGAVSRVILAARPDVHVTGIDFARLPLTIRSHVELLSDTAMECLPFAEESFGAVISQFGYEYSQMNETAREIALVLAPGARLSLLVHHADSAVVANNRSRMCALDGFLGHAMRAAFAAGDSTAFAALMSALTERHPHDTLIEELARSLPSRLQRTPRERIAIWNAIEEALAPERCLADSLNERCVAPAQLDNWLAPLRDVCELQPVSVLREPDGQPIAWKIEGARAG